jgi:hypothetical protein
VVDRRHVQRRDEQRPDVAEQDVLGHVGGEQVVLAEAVERRDQRRREHEHRRGECPSLKRAGPAPAGLAPGRAEAAYVEERAEREGRDRAGLEAPVELR